MPSHLIDSLATTDALAAVFADASLLQSMLDVESALARVEARLQVIPESAADAIAAAAVAGHFDASELARAARASGTLAIPLVEVLTARVRSIDPASAAFVHWGATSQDIIDSAMLLAIRRAQAILAADHDRLDAALRALSDRHARTVMLGRTLLQPAAPITFGLKVAGWVAALGRSWTRVTAALDDALVIQFGGATGTLAALGPPGVQVGRALAGELGLGSPDAPWHAHRDRLAALVAAYGIYTAALGKIARDVALLMQDEVGEVAEPYPAGGGSSAMPHKRNPAASAVALAAATRVPGLVAAFLTGTVQEHERSVGGWHAEWPTIAAVVQATGAALDAMTGAIEALEVNADRMRENVEKTGGVIAAERAVLLLAPTLGREASRRIVTELVQQSRRTGERFGEALKRAPDVAGVLSTEQLTRIDTPEDDLGHAETFRQQLLAAAPPRARK